MKKNSTKLLIIQEKIDLLRELNNFKEIVVFKTGHSHMVIHIKWLNAMLNNLLIDKRRLELGKEEYEQV